MTEPKYYLDPNVKVEPLFNRWYAWPHLIAPATAALNIANSHVKIMRSYVAAPDIHAAAVKNPAMRGGPFLDVEKRRAGEVKQLLEKTLAEQSAMIEFADAVQRLNEILQVEAAGGSLEPVYAKVPDRLRGYVELGYDLNKNPSLRFVERLLYRSRYYDPSRQSVVLSRTDSDDRPFVFSTPRLSDEGQLHLQVPFGHEGIDRLFRMRSEPQPISHVEEVFGLGRDSKAALAPLFVEEARPAPARYDGDSLRVRYMGHACILIETKDVSILTDPLISYEREGGVPRFTYADLPETIDYVLITHNHSDHLVFETLLQLRHKIRNIIVPRCSGGTLEDPSVKLILENIGFRNVYEIDEMETVPVEGGEITGLPFFGEHGDLHIRSKICHLIRLGGKSVLCAADSCNLEPKLYEHVHTMTGDLDLLFLGMECDGAPLSWMYGPLLLKSIDRKMDHARRLCGSDYAKGIEIVRQFNCRQVYVYAMGQEPWLNFITSIKYTEESRPIVESNRLVADCLARGIAAERLFGAKEIHL